VTELASVLQLPQSTVSRHLRTLSEEGWVVARAEGTSRRYRMGAEGLDAERLGPAMRRLWGAVREPIAALPAAAHDAERLRAVLAQRRTATQAFFSSAAGRWDRLRGELFGERVELTALLGLLDEELVVGDLGCGTGAVTAALAGHVRRVVAVDGSRAMLAAARRRLQEHPNVELRAGDLEQLPLGTGELDAALFVLVLHHVPEPSVALAEAARALRTGGRLVVVDMLPHDREAYRQEMGHVWLGLAEDQLRCWLEAAGFERARFTPLPADPAAKGPTLFSASARRAPGPPPLPSTGA
jgi:ubiquinone/menaquinone biosynthesis C-methylase UbiE/DNA-binding transcriptional ArsR family regulator